MKSLIFLLLLIVPTYSFFGGIVRISRRGENGSGGGVIPPRGGDGPSWGQFDDDGDHQRHSGAHGLIGVASLASSICVSDGYEVYGENLAMVNIGGMSVLIRQVRRAFRSIDKAFKSLRSSLQSSDTKQLAKLEKTVVVDVIAPNSTVLPPHLVRRAAREAGLISGYLNSTTVTSTARLLKSFYNSNGYVLCEISSASVTPDGIVSLTVVEPKVGEKPVGMQFLKEMVVNPEDGSTVSFKKFNEMQERRKVVKKLKREDLNTTFVPTTGRTRGDVIARTLRMKTGNVFRWNNDKWQSVAKSGLFELVRTKPTIDEEGNVMLLVTAAEKPSRNLEYGVTKSLYTGEWEGEMCFDHKNLLGGNEVGSLVFRRGAQDPCASYKARFENNMFGSPGGYSVDLFSEYIGEGEEGGLEGKVKGATQRTFKDLGMRLFGNKDGGDVKGTYVTSDMSESGDDFGMDSSEDSIVSTATVQSSTDDGTLPSPAPKPDAGGNPDNLFVKRGAKFRVNKPLSKICYNSAASASVERTSTVGGTEEIIGSLSCDVGPVVNYIPLVGGAHSLLTTVTGGGRLTSGKDVLPYTSSTVVSKELIPLTSSEIKKPLVLGLRHTLHASSASMPLHEAQAAGCNAKIRGYGSKSVGAISQAVTGTVEVRVPSNMTNKYGKDLGVVVFGDWILSKRVGEVGGGGESSEGGKDDIFNRKYAVGVGLRGNAMGIPLKYDIGVNKERDVVTSFGIGGDFQV